MYILPIHKPYAETLVNANHEVERNPVPRPSTARIKAKLNPRTKGVLNIEGFTMSPLMSCEVSAVASTEAAFYIISYLLTLKLI